MNDLNKIMTLVSEPSYKYLYRYNLTRTKRFIAQFLLIFIFQYLTIINLTFSYPALPIYPPMGIAFVMFYLFGRNAFWGLLIGGSCGYLLKGLPTTVFLVNLTADIGCGLLGATLSLRIFSSDIMRPMNLKEWGRFIITNALITCVISGLIRITPLILHHEPTMQLNILFYYFIDFWLADLNAILVLASFLLSWLSIHLSREKISLRPINKLLVASLIIFIGISVLFIKNDALLYLLVAAMMVSIYMSYLYGFLVSTLLLYVISMLYLTYFIGHQFQYLSAYGLQLYTLVPTSLFLFILVIFYTSSKDSK